MRLPLSEAFSTRCRAMRATPTCMAMSGASRKVRLAEPKGFDHLVERRAVLLELLGRRGTADDVRRRAFEHSDLKAAGLKVAAAGVALRKGKDTADRRVVGGRGWHHLLGRVARHLLLHADLHAG